METYNYQVLHEEDYRILPNNDALSNSSIPIRNKTSVDLPKLQYDLERFGAEGFRFIETVYNSDGTWIILLSRPLNQAYVEKKPPYERRERYTKERRF